MDRERLKELIDYSKTNVAFWTEQLELCEEELKDRPNLKDGDPVVVWGNSGRRRNRYFKEWGKEGEIVCWNDGKTRWTAIDEEDCNSHCNYELPEEFEKVIY